MVDQYCLGDRLTSYTLAGVAKVQTLFLTKAIYGHGMIKKSITIVEQFGYKKL